MKPDPLLDGTPGRSGPAPLALVVELCEALANENVNYCHWKSNTALDRSASGENDLDLLIAREDTAKFCEILFRLRFKLALAPAQNRMPGVQEFFGYDAAEDRFVHLQAHYQLVLGHDRTKNYVLPVADAYLASSDRNALFRTPAVEFEYAVFIIRMVLKYLTWDAAFSGRTTLKPTEQQELLDLRMRVDETQLAGLVAEHLSFVGNDLFRACVRALDPACGTWSRVSTADRLQRRLRAHGRRGVSADVWLKFWRRLVLSLRRRSAGGPPRYRLTGGGALIAIIGGDGAGKTTAIADLRGWLAPYFDTRTVHLGRPRWSKTTYLVRAGVKLCHLVVSRIPLARLRPADRREAVGLRRLLWYACTARDRYLSYLRARRFTLNGGITICDRFPHPAIKLMDGPQISRLTGDHDSRLLDWLAAMETRYHRAIEQPDLLFLLRVDPDIAVRRKTDEDSQMVRVRSTEVWALSRDSIQAHSIDAGQNRKQVLRELKLQIWSRL